MNSVGGNIASLQALFVQPHGFSCFVLEEQTQLLVYGRTDEDLEAVC